MLVLSLAVNILILIPVLGGLLRQRAATQAAFGPDSVARRILACLYGTILVTSGGILGLLAIGSVETARIAGATLLSLQVIYKLATVPAVGLHNPVAVTNLAIAVLHGVTLVVLLSAGA